MPVDAATPFSQLTGWHIAGSSPSCSRALDSGHSEPHTFKFGMDTKATPETDGWLEGKKTIGQKKLLKPLEGWF